MAKKFDAVEWVKSVTPFIGGNGGGGRPDMTQGDGSDAAKLPEIFEKAKEYFG